MVAGVALVIANRSEMRDSGMPWEQLQQSSTFGFTVVVLIVVFGPLIAERARLSGLMGLLLGGALIGPNMFYVLSSFESLDSVGTPLLGFPCGLLRNRSITADVRSWPPPRTQGRSPDSVARR